MNYKRALSVLLTGVLALLVLISTSVFAQDDDMQVLTISATEDGIVVPEIVAAGLAEITFENTTEIPFYSIIARLDEDASMDEFMGELMGVFAGDASALPPANFLGSPLALPGETQTAMYNLEAGMYIVLSVAGEEPDMATFVVEGEAVERVEIEADLVVPFADFVFGLPSELVAGEQIWQIENRGEQWHEMVFISVPEGSTMEDAMMMLMPPPAEEPANGEASAEATEEVAQEEGGPMDGLTYLWSPMSSGNSALTSVNLEPGTYLVLCFIPDSTSEEGLSHAEQGMMQIVTVVEADE